MLALRPERKIAATDLTGTVDNCYTPIFISSVYIKCFMIF